MAYLVNFIVVSYGEAVDMLFDMNMFVGKQFSISSSKV